MAYTPQTWTDGSGGGTPLSAARLNYMETGIDQAHDLTGTTNLSYTASPTNGVVASNTGTDATLTLSTGTNAGLMAPAQFTKLADIETAADVTDAANVAAAGAVMESDTSTAAMNFVIDEDNMASNSATKVPTQQSVKAYVDASGGTSSIVTTAKQTSAVTDAVATDVNVTGLSFSVVSGTRYHVKFMNTWQSSDTTNGAQWSISGPTMTAFMHVVMSRQGGVGVDMFYESSTTSVGNQIGGATVNAINSDYPAINEAFFQPSANGTIQLQVRRTGAGAGNIDVANTGIGILTNLG